MFDTEGKLIAVLPEQTGTGKNGAWSKRDFVIETNEQYPKKLCFSAWGDKNEILKTVETGAKLKVTFIAESREFNGKWYTDLKVWKIDGDNSQGSQRPMDSYKAPAQEGFVNTPEDDISGDLPF